MTTVIQVVQHLCPGGIETMVLDLADHDADHEHTWIVSLEGNLESALEQWPRLRPYTERLIFLDKGQGTKPLLIPRLAWLFRRLQADVVHTHHIGPLLYAGSGARLAGIKRLIHTEHDAWHLSDARRSRLQRGLLRRVRPTLVADAESVAAGLRQYLGLERVRVIRNGIDTQRFMPGDPSLARRRLGLPEGVPLVGCSGRLETVKGQSLLIEALNLMPSDVHLALAGAGSTETELRRQTELLGLQFRVHFLGRVDRMPNFYQALDAFCLPSLNEGLPLSPLEAQACGVPAVVTDVGGAKESLCPLSGKLVPGNDAFAIAKSLQQLLAKGPLSSPRRFVQKQGNVRLMANAYGALH